MCRIPRRSVLWLAATALLASAVAASTGTCGAAGQPPCTSGDPCETGTVEFSGVCRLCGDASQPACADPASDPCMLGLQLAEVGGDILCVPLPCGEAGQQTCPTGEPCIEGTTVFSTFCRLCGGASQPPCSSGAACSAGFAAVEEGDVTLCMAVLCGEPGQPPCSVGTACTPGTILFDNVCRLCGAASQPACGGGEPCDGGLQAVDLDDGTFCFPLPCGEAGQPPCESGEACQEGTTPFDDVCRICGGASQPVCISGTACGEGLMAADIDGVKLCVSMPCGEAGQQVCMTGEPCVGGTVVFGSFCRLCGGASQPACAEGDACGEELLLLEVAGVATCLPVPCGEAGQFTCVTGAPCVAGTSVAGSFCRLCGGPAQPVCDSGDACQPGFQVKGGSDSDTEALCMPVTCGAAGQPPCATGEACAAGTVAFDDVCRLCGGASQPLCAGDDACEGGLLGVVVEDDLLCESLPCGSAGQVTCPGEAPCVEGTTVFLGFCRLCGSVSQPVCTDGDACEPGLLLEEEVSSGYTFCMSPDGMGTSSGGYGH